MLLGDLCTYVIINIINITVYLMLLLLTVFRIKDMFKSIKRTFFLSELLLLLILAFIFIFTPDTYIGSKYRLSVYLICNNRYRYRPWKTHIGRPLVLTRSSNILCRPTQSVLLWRGARFRHGSLFCHQASGRINSSSARALCGIGVAAYVATFLVNVFHLPLSCSYLASLDNASPI